MNNNEIVAKKEKSNIPLIVINIILIVIVLCLCVYIIFDKINNNESTTINTPQVIEDSTNSNTSVNIEDNSTTPQTKNEEKTTEEKVKEQFADYMSKNDNVSDYKIMNIIIQDKNNNASLGYEDTDILVVINYDVKPKDGVWAGNGVENGDWYEGCSLCAYLRNGNLTIVGTGW